MVRGLRYSERSTSLNRKTYVNFIQRIIRALFNGSNADHLHVHASAGVSNLTEADMATAATHEVTAAGASLNILHANKQSVHVTINNAGDNTCTIDDGVINGQRLEIFIATKTAGEIIIADAGSEAGLEGRWYHPLAGYGLLVSWDGTQWNEIKRYTNGNTNSGLRAGSVGGVFNTNSSNNVGSVGGYTNTNSIDGAGSVGGSFNVNSGVNSSSLGGSRSAASLYGQQAHAAGFFAATGDAQGSELIARRTVNHADPSWYTLLLDGDNAGGGGTILPDILADTVWTFEAQIVGTTQGCTKSFGFLINGVIENDGGTTTLLASNVTTLYNGDDVGVSAQAVADDGNDSLLIQVRDTSVGAPSTIRWVTTIKFTSVNFPA